MIPDLRLAKPLMLAAAAFVVAFLSAFLAWTVATWHADAAHAEVEQGLRDRLETAIRERHEIELAVESANRALAVASAQSEAAEAAKSQAMKHAEEMAELSKGRLDKLATVVASANGCSDVLSRYWEIRK